MNIAGLFLIVCALWIISEILLQILRRSKKEDQDHDSGSVKRLNLIVYVSVAVGTFFAFTNIGNIKVHHSTMFLCGLILIILGLLIRWIAILTLRQFFTVNVAIKSNHVIIETRLYKYVRHPSYLGLLISFLGVGLGLSNWISIIVLLVPITFALMKRIQVEELALSKTFGDKFNDYCKRTWRLIPWIY